MMKVFLAFLSFFLFFAGSVTNKESGLNVLKSEKGFLFIFNDSIESFLVEVPGKKFVDVEPEELIFSVDGQILQFTIVPFKEFYDARKSGDTLRQHFEFEVEYISKNFKIDSKQFKPTIFQIGSGTKGYYWELERETSMLDTSSETVVKQIFSSANTSRYVVLLSSPITRGNDYKQCRQRIFETMKSFRYINGAFDIDSIRNSMRIK
jgi:hypothetical protein